MSRCLSERLAPAVPLMLIAPMKKLFPLFIPMLLALALPFGLGESGAQGQPTPAVAATPSASSTPPGETKKEFDGWRPAFDIALGVVGLAGGILALWKSQSEKRAHQAQALQTDSAPSILRMASSNPVPEFSHKRPYKKYILVGLIGFTLLVSSLISMSVVYRNYAVRAEAEWAVEYFSGLEIQEEKKLQEIKGELAQATEERRLDWEERLALREELVRTVKKLKELNQARLANNLSHIMRYVGFSIAAVLLFLFAWPRLRTFAVWLWSRPWNLDRASKTGRKVELVTSLSFDNAVARCLSVIKKTEAQLISIKAEDKPCLIHAVRNYKGPNSYFEDIRFEIDEAGTASTIKITVDGLRPSLRRDSVRNQFIVSNLVDHLTS